MRIIVGLGNPGKEYEKTYHNVGQIALSMFYGLPARWQAHKHLFEYADLGEITLVRPLTFMNESGKAVREALKKFSAKPKDLIVIHDDSDITVGNYKMSFARSSAGHKGVQSIIDALKTNEFLRGRIGIRPATETRRKKAGEFALSPIKARDLAALKKVYALLIDECHRERIPSAV